jgi:hypothetical protein
MEARSHLANHTYNEGLVVAGSALNLIAGKA